MVGRHWNTGAWVVGIAVNQTGTHAAAALGDGTVWLVDLADAAGEPQCIHAHDGACLALARDADEHGFLTGGDDGRLCRVVPDAPAETLATTGGRWVEHVDATPHSGLRAFSAGRTVTVIDRAGRPVRAVLEHPSTVGGLAFAPKGRRLAAAHYGGVSLWWMGSDSAPVRLGWKGSHLGVSWHPAGTHLMTTMQENELHGWRLKDAADMRMSGYAAKIRSLGWTDRGRWLATAGADVVVCWPFFGGGPWERSPLELPDISGSLVTAVAPHPTTSVVVAGCSTGLTYATSLDGGTPVVLTEPDGSPVSALAWSGNGRHLLVGTEGGRLSWLPVGPADRRDA